MSKTLPRPPHHPPRHGVGRRVGVALALLALLLAQAVGLAHRVWHDPGHGGGHGQHGVQQTERHGRPAIAHLAAHAGAHPAAHDGAPGAAHDRARVAAHPGALAEDPFHGHGEGSAECRLLDQLAHADALPGAASVALPDMPPAVPNGLAPCSAPARHGPAYLARAPPGRADADPAARSG